MSQQIRTVILIGASGNLGSAILKAFLNSGKFNISVLRRPKTVATFPDSVNVVEAEYTLVSLQKAFKGHDAVVSCVGRVSLADQKMAIDAAINAGVKRIITSEFGINTTNDITLEICPFLQPKADLVNYVNTRVIDHPITSWTAIITGAFFDWSMKNGAAGFDLKTNTATIWDDGNDRFSTTNRSTVGKAVVSVLENSTKTKNRYIFVASFITTQREILKVLEKVTQKNWTIKKVQTEEQIKLGRKMLGEGDMSGAMKLIVAGNLTPTAGADFEAQGILDNDTLRLPKENLEATIKALSDGEEV